MLTLVIALISCLGVVVASIVNHRAITAAARITAADPRPRRARGRPPAAPQRDRGRARIQAGATLQAARLAHSADLPPSAT